MKSRWCFVILVSMFLCFNVAITWAAYPEKPITIIMPFAPGGVVEICNRPLSAAAAEILGQPIVLEFQSGGSGAVGLGILKNKKPDGYTIGVITHSPLIGQHMKKTGYDILKDFEPIMQYDDTAFGIAVRADSPWKTLKEFLDYAKANPKKIRYSTAGPGTPNALNMAALARHLQIEWTHIPFDGGVQALSALMGGHVEAYSCSMHAKSQIQSGRLRLLAALGEQRIPSFPDVPTLLELGIPLTANNFNALVAPRGTPPEIVETIHQAYKKAMQDPAFIKAIEAHDQIVIYRGPQEMAKYLQEQDKAIIEALKMVGLFAQ